MRTNTDTSDSNTSDTTTRAGAMSRRTLAGGAIGAGLLAAGALQVSRAQTDSSATPEAGTDATPAIVTIDERNADRVDAWIERASTAITTARTDRDAVASQIDTETIDSVLDQAEHLRDEAQDASDTGDALRFAAAATVTAGAGQRLILAELAYTGLPSQEAPASRILERAHTVITEVTDAVAGEDEADVTFAVATAQEFYRTAYDAFGDGAYDRAARMARAAVALASVAVILTGSGAGLPRMGRGDAPGGIQMPFPPGMHDERGINGIEEGDGEPVTPPAPDFPAI